MKNIMDTINSHASLTTLADYLAQTSIPETLQGAGPFTLFAPDNDAFERMNIGEALKDHKNLVETFTYHLVSGTYTAAAISALDELSTEAGKSLMMNLEEGEVVVDNAKLVTADIQCSNGLIHIIDNVFQPQLSGWYREE